MHDKITPSDKIKNELNIFSNKSETVFMTAYLRRVFGKATKEKACAYAQNSVPNQ